MQSPQEWLTEQFEYEYCAECGGDAQHHTVCIVPVTATYFARCDYPPSEHTQWEQHPVIKEYRATQEVS